MDNDPEVDALTKANDDEIKKAYEKVIEKREFRFIKGLVEAEVRQTNLPTTSEEILFDDGVKTTKRKVRDIVTDFRRKFGDTNRMRIGVYNGLYYGIGINPLGTMAIFVESRKKIFEEITGCEASKCFVSSSLESRKLRKLPLYNGDEHIEKMLMPGYAFNYCVLDRPQDILLNFVWLSNDSSASVKGYGYALKLCRDIIDQCKSTPIAVDQTSTADIIQDPTKIEVRENLTRMTNNMILRVIAEHKHMQFIV